MASVLSPDASYINFEMINVDFNLYCPLPCYDRVVVMIWNFATFDSEILCKFPNVEDLRCTNRGLKSLIGIGVFRKLKKLDISSTLISSLDGIKNCINIREIDMKMCVDLLEYDEFVYLPRLVHINATDNTHPISPNDLRYNKCFDWQRFLNGSMAEKYIMFNKKYNETTTDCTWKTSLKLDPHNPDIEKIHRNNINYAHAFQHFIQITRDYSHDNILIESKTRSIKGNSDSFYYESNSRTGIFGDFSGYTPDPIHNISITAFIDRVIWLIRNETEEEKMEIHEHVTGIVSGSKSTTRIIEEVLVFLHCLQKYNIPPSLEMQLFIERHNNTTDTTVYSQAIDFTNSNYNSGNETLTVLENLAITSNDFAKMVNEAITQFDLSTLNECTYITKINCINEKMMEIIHLWNTK